MKLHMCLSGCLVFALTTALCLGADKPAGDKGKEAPRADLPAKDAKEEKNADGKDARSESGLKGYYAILAVQLKLTDEQKARLETAVKASAEAAKGKDEKEAAKIREKLRDDVTAILTPEQRVQRTFFHKYSRYSLTDEQKDKLRSLCAEASRQAGGKDLSEDAAQKLDGAIAALLTPEQKAKLDKSREGKKSHGEKSAESRPSDGAVTDKKNK